MKNVIVSYDYDDVYKIKFDFIKGKYNTYKCNTIITYDTETSSGSMQSDHHVLAFDPDRYVNDEDYRKNFDNGEKVACLYLWQCAIENDNEIYVFLGRDLDSYLDFVLKLTTEVRRQAFFGVRSINRSNENAISLQRKSSVTLLTYVHNLGFEYQFLRNLFNDDFSKGRSEHVFARTIRKPMKASINLNRVNLEYRDTAVLTQKSLKSWCSSENLEVKKLDEPDDFYLETRTPKTPLSDEVLKYSVNDVVCMVYGMIKYRAKYGDLYNIPITQTGSVRRKLYAEVCKKNVDWSSQCYCVTNNYTFDFFKKLTKLFSGGWTHGNRYHIGKVINAKCFDFASSYPYVMATSKFPTTDFINCDVNEFDALASQDLHKSDVRWFAKIRIVKPMSKLQNTYWSVSKCENELEHMFADNGRVITCDEMVIYATDYDWDTFTKAYDYSSIEVLELYKAEAHYLPRELIMLILNMYNYKTTLKNVAGSEALYKESKEWINSLYGCFVTKIVTDAITFANGDWCKTPYDYEIFTDTISHTKIDKSFGSYQLGIWVTSIARHNLWHFISLMDERVTYCDTDSFKGDFTDEDLALVDDYNKQVEAYEQEVANFYSFDSGMYAPTNPSGKECRLGIADREHDCKLKTLGAKRYITEDEEGLHMTVAGLPKKSVSKLKSIDEFRNNTVWNVKESGKKCCYYNDNQKETIWTDGNGISYTCYDMYTIAILPTSFDMSMSNEFEHLVNLLNGNIDNTDEFFVDIPACLL